jgi:hypothetical protein
LIPPPKESIKAVDTTTQESIKAVDTTTQESIKAVDTTTQESIEAEPNTSMMSSHDYFKHILQKDVCSDEMKLKKELDGMICNVGSMLNSCSDINILQTVKQHMQSAISILNVGTTLTSSASTTIAVPVDPIPSNSGRQKQFYSTRRKRTSSMRWSKPSIVEEKEASEKIQKMNIDVCNVCWRENDTVESDEVDWISCEVCGVWLHLSCSGHDQSSTAFVCDICKND